MALNTCPECGREVSDKAASCPSCGAPLNNMQNKKFCQHCGEQIDKDCVVCPKCGKQVGSFNNQNTDKNIIINNNNSTSSSAAAVNQGGYVRVGKPVNKIVYCLLAFFLGGIGIHKFYAGKIGMGIVYLLFCWTFIPGFIAFIEFIIGLCKKADANGNIWF